MAYAPEDNHLSLIFSGKFQFPSLVRIGTPLDGSCLIHAILQAYHRNYIESSLNGQLIPRSSFAQQTRQDLAEKLGYPDARGIRPYDQLWRGQLANWARPHAGRTPQEAAIFTLDAMQSALNSDAPIDLANVWEFLSDYFNKDIYVLDYRNQDVYAPQNTDRQLLTKNRDAIVILYISGGTGHFETVGLEDEESGQVFTLFKSTSQLITAINRRLDQLGLSRS